MNYHKYKSQFSGHTRQARKLMSKFIKESELALMTDDDIEKGINEYYIAIQFGDNWMLVQRENLDAFEKIITWINR